MDDESAEIELVNVIYRHLQHKTDRNLLVTAKPEQDSTVIEEDDQYEFPLTFELLITHLTRRP